jgi:hypothetical protein
MVGTAIKEEEEDDDALPEGSLNKEVGSSITIRDRGSPRDSGMEHTREPKEDRYYRQYGSQE